MPALVPSTEISYCREPLQIRLVPVPRLLLAGEERVGLFQDERVGAALPPGHVADGQFRGVNPGVDVLPALLGERPLEYALVRVFQEHAEGVAQVARAVAGRALRAGEPGAEPCRAVGGQVAEA